VEEVDDGIPLAAGRIAGREIDGEPKASCYRRRVDRPLDLQERFAAGMGTTRHGERAEGQRQQSEGQDTHHSTVPIFSVA
jgi:hypothetical protein